VGVEEVKRDRSAWLTLGLDIRGGRLEMKREAEGRVGEFLHNFDRKR
jgi:hypothetical protein